MFERTATSAPLAPVGCSHQDGGNHLVLYGLAVDLILDQPRQDSRALAVTTSTTPRPYCHGEIVIPCREHIVVSQLAIGRDGLPTIIGAAQSA